MTARITWTAEALRHVTPSRRHDLVKAELPTAAVAWNELRKWILSIAPHVTAGIDPRLAVAVCSRWGGEAPPSTFDIISTASAWRLLGQGFGSASGEKQFAAFITRAFGLRWALEAFVGGPPVQVTHGDRHFGAPATPLTNDAWRAMRCVWLASDEAARAEATPRLREILASDIYERSHEPLLLMLEESPTSLLTAASLDDARARLGDLDWAKVQHVHELRFDLLASIGADAATLLIDALGHGREHGMGVELQREFVTALALVESPEVAQHMQAELRLTGTRDLAESYGKPRAEVPSAPAMADPSAELEAALRTQRRWTRDAFTAEILHNATVREVARRLVWATYEDGFILDTFRVGADGALSVGAGFEYELPDDAPIGLVQRSELDDLTAAQWVKVLADHALTPPFAQL